MLTVKQVASRLNISLGAVYKAMQDGVLEHHRFGSALRISEEQLEEYLQQSRVLKEANAFRVSRFKHL